MQKEYQLAVDIEKKILTPSFEVNTLDLKTIRLKITITKGMTLVDLTGITVRMSIRKPDGNVLFQDCQVVNAKGGQVEIILENQAYVLPGSYSAEIMCFKGTDKVAVTGSFSYRSIKGIMDDKAVESKSEFTAITKQLDDVQATVNDLRENGTGIDAQARQEVEQVTAQLADVAINVKTYGAVGDGKFHSIRDTISNYNTLNLKALHPDATPDNSVDWYAIQKAIDENNSVYLVGNFLIDLPITIKYNSRKLFGSKFRSIIQNVSNKLDSIVVGDETKTEVYSTTLSQLRIIGDRHRSGNGVHVANATNLVIEDSYIYSHRIGVYSGPSNNCWVLRMTDVSIAYNKEHGIKIEHRFTKQKNSITLLNVTASDNGYNDLDQKLFDVNQPTKNIGHGISISGTNISITNSNAERNGGAGLYLGGTHAESLLSGFSITGCYFEPNRLTDIYIDNETNTFIGLINGNYLGSKEINKSLYKGVYISNRQKINESSNIENNSSYLLVEKDTFALNGKLRFNQNRRQLYSDKRIIFAKGKYELYLEYTWNKVTSNSSFMVGLNGLDFDGNPIVKDTTPAYVQTRYAKLTQDTKTTDKVLYFDDLTGFDITSYTNLVIYNTVLSDETVIGRDYSTTYISKSNIANIDLEAKTITLINPIGKIIKSDTEATLNLGSGSSSIVGDYLVLNSTQTNARKVFDSESIPYAKHLYYLQPVYVFQNVNNVNDDFQITRLRYDRDYTSSITPESWKTPTFANGWIQALGFIGYYKDTSGVVRIQGSVSNPSVTLNSVIFTLPTGYRPSSTLVFTGVRRDTPDVVLHVRNNGEVVYVKGGSRGDNIEWASLSSISFRVDS